MIKCKNCNALIRDEDKYCRNCGIQIPSNLTMWFYKLFTILIAVGVIGFAILFIASYIVE